MGESHQDLVDQYGAFLSDEGYVERIAAAIDRFENLNLPPQERRGIRVGFRPAELRAVPDLWNGLRSDPYRHLRAFEAACKEAVEERPLKDAIRVSVSGPFAAHALSPRQLTSQSLRQLVCVEGVATQVSAIQPKVVQSVHYCPATGQEHTRTHVDATDPNLGLPELAGNEEKLDRLVSITTGVYPTADGEGNPLETEFGRSSYKDHQRLVLQEMPEKAPMGQLPRSIELILDHDLVDKVKPGDRIRVTGVYRALATLQQKQTSGVFRTVLLVNNVEWLSTTMNRRVTMATSDIEHIRAVAERTDILTLLGRSIAPSIFGHAPIKQALALQLLGGMERNLVNGTHLRGDINILMVGDPSTAKSQLLRAAMKLAPLAISTTGKGSSGVGLTAAVTSDPDTRERRLEAGAMVLADRGIVCVDEFDKMGENDRVAIHEAMEQQTVTIAKAGIHASLNARCAVLAAANPVYGQYDRQRALHENIGLPDSLLSRFDLLFVVLDQMDPVSDRQIATHVLRGHATRQERPVSLSDDEQEHDEFLGVDPSTTHGVWQSNQTEGDILTHAFLRKYLRYAKMAIKPTLQDETREWIARHYAEMRARPSAVAVTARSLETMIRLSTAHAKARLSRTVDIQDAQAAIKILAYSLYHEETGDDKASGPATDDQTSMDADDDNSEQDENERPVKRQRSEDEESTSTDLVDAKKHILKSLQESQDESLDVDKFSDFREALQELQNEDRIHVGDGQVMLMD